MARLSRQMVFETLAAANAGTPLGELCQRLASGQGGIAPEERTRLLTELFTQGGAGTANPDEAELLRSHAARDYVADQGPQRVTMPRTQIVQRLRSRLREAELELAALRSRNDELAAALGACYLCWGEDPRCPECSGSGQAGKHKQPDQTLFRKYMLPAARLLFASGKASTAVDKEEPKDTETTINPNGEG